MSGKYSGVQVIIREICRLADYVPCTAHSHNLAGKSATESCPVAYRCFEFIQALYSWLVASTHRWQVHKKYLKGLPVNKALSDTRWFARHYAVKTSNKGYNQNILALEELSTGECQQAETRIEAGGIP